VSSFSYHKSVFIGLGKANEDVKNHITKANGTFVQLYLIWENRNVLRKTKLLIFKNRSK
jgi:hypothetical protein